MKKYFLYSIFLVLSQLSYSQKLDILSFSEYIGYVKKHHPIVKQAHLVINESEVKLLKARGAFDPKLEVDYTKKQFKETTYFDKLNATFKIPTWYGVEVKGNFEQNSGTYLNPENTVPQEGLYNLGLSVSLAKGLLMNKRMATLKQAKLFQKRAKAENQLAVNAILYQASKSYFKWLKTHQEKQVYQAFLNNAKLRLQGVKRSYALGEKPAIDTTEARITLNNRKLSLEKAKLNYVKASLELSNYLWINEVPVVLKNNISPENEVLNSIDTVLQINTIVLNRNVAEHPKLQALDYKYKAYEIDQKLKRNNLLPKVNLQYNFLNKSLDLPSTLSTNNYKFGLDISIPLFLRKERAELKLTKYKLQAIEFDKQTVSLELQNKFNAIQQEITSYQNQIDITADIIADYTLLVKGEERKFSIGESSLFLINYRESKLIENKLKAIKLENVLLNAKGKLFNTFGISL